MASAPLSRQADFETAAAAVRPWSLWAWAAGGAARVARVIAEEARARRDRRALMAMSDQMLKDIGLTRGGIGDALRNGRD